jgi:hypothetical protein
MVKGRVKWFTNIYVAGSGYKEPWADPYDTWQYTGEQEGWYPWAS